MSEPIRPRGRGPLIALIAVGAALVIAVVVVIWAALARGDDGSASPTTTGSPTSSSSSSPSATPTPTPPAADPAFLMPECSAMRAAFIEEGVAAGDIAEAADDDPSAIAERLPGPSAVDALATATATRLCTWSVANSDAIWRTAVAELGDPEWDALTAALVADGWTPIDVAGASGFTIRWEEPTVNDDHHTWIYLRVGDAWIIAGPEYVGGHLDVLDAAVAGVRAANP